MEPQRICLGAFRHHRCRVSMLKTVISFPLDSSTEKAVSLRIIFKIFVSAFTSSAECVYSSTSMKRLYDARPSNIRPFMDRMKLHILNSTYLTCMIQQTWNLFLFRLPWNTEHKRFTLYPTLLPPDLPQTVKSTVAPVVRFHASSPTMRSQYSRYSAIYTDGSKRQIRCTKEGVVIKDIMPVIRSTFRSFNGRSCRHLPCTSKNRLHYARKYCIYTDSMLVYSKRLKTIHDRCHNRYMYIHRHYRSTLTAKTIRYRVCWPPNHVRNHRQRASGRAKQKSEATTHLPHLTRSPKYRI
ncbi:hypothetical protein TNCV_3633311 [Trichonephila clavipes]|nr:hypothetical protein TNCV_3633311 [Trichonephila clavipes]